MNKDRTLQHYALDIKQAAYVCDEFNDAEVGAFFRALIRSCQKVDTIPIETKNEELKYFYKMHSKTYMQPTFDKYNCVCDAKAQNGSKGGNAKAAKCENATASQTNGGYSLPNKTDFRNLAKSISKDYGLDYDQYRIDTLYDDLKKDKPDFVLSNKDLEILAYGVLIGNLWHAKEFLKKAHTLNKEPAVGDFDYFMELQETSKKPFNELFTEFFTDEDD